MQGKVVETGVLGVMKKVGGSLQVCAIKPLRSPGEASCRECGCSCCYELQWRSKCEDSRGVEAQVI